VSLVASLDSLLREAEDKVKQESINIDDVEKEDVKERRVGKGLFASKQTRLADTSACANSDASNTSARKTNSPSKPLQSQSVE
jgi:hypothetical protein